MTVFQKSANIFDILLQDELQQINTLEMVAEGSHCICIGSDDRDSLVRSSTGKSHRRRNKAPRFCTDLIRTSPRPRYSARQQNLN